jgi:hypothetical protein
VGILERTAKRFASLFRLEIGGLVQTISRGADVADFFDQV